MHLHRILLECLARAPRRDPETSALALLALRHTNPALESLLRFQQRDGAWSAAGEGGPRNIFVTSLALLGIRPFASSNAVKDSARRAVSWLSSIRGRECHWFWKWKFLLVDRQVRFDPTKSGWPWLPGTVSWVAPTAMAILALRAWRQLDSPHLRKRIERGTAMLLDRACQSGGWNAGNSAVFGNPLDPHPDFTAMALLALRASPAGVSAAVRQALGYLPTRLAAASSPYSLSWSVMALAAYGRDVEFMRQRLASAVERRLYSLSPDLMALSALALEDPPFDFQDRSWTEEH